MGKTLFLFYFLVLISSSLFGENDERSPLVEPADKIHQPSDSLRFDFSADFRSRHIWRGSLTCSAWNIQPTLNLSKSNFLIGAWGAYTIDNSYTEFDLYMSYTLGSFTFGVLDYFCPDETKKFHNFFDVANSSTKHTFDATISFNGTQRIPLSVMVSTLFFGDDKNPATGENYYSTYIETAYKWKPNEKLNVDFHLGFTPTKGLYASSANIVSIGTSLTQEVVITPSFSIPLNGKLILNPYTENIYFVFGFTIGV